MFSFFSGDHAGLMATVIAFTAFFLIARVARARQGVSLAFAFTPLLAMLGLAGLMVAFH